MIKVFFFIFAIEALGFHFTFDKKLTELKHNSVYLRRKYRHFLENSVLHSFKEKKYSTFMNRLVLGFSHSKNKDINGNSRKMGSFLSMQSIMGPYDANTAHFPVSIYARRDEKKKKESMIPLSGQWDDKNIGPPIHRLGFYKGDAGGFFEKDKASRENLSHLKRLSEFFIKILPSWLTNTIKHDVGYRASVEKVKNKYHDVDGYKVYTYKYTNRINIRSFILGHRPKTCYSVFEGSGVNDRIKKCLERGSKKTRCKTSFDATCICDSAQYFNLIKECLRGFSQKDILSLYDYYYSICKNPVPPHSNCLNTYKSTQEIVYCPKPYLNFGLGYQLEECIELAVHDSLCKEFYDASCLCDSISFKKSIVECITGSMLVVNKIHSFHQTICGNPLHLSGCTKLSISELSRPRSCISMFVGIVPDGGVRRCLENLAINSRCGNNVNAPCICDSFSFISSFDTCFQFSSHVNSEDIRSSLNFYCAKSYLLGKCFDENKKPTKTKICPGFYKKFGYNEDVQQCIFSLAKKSICDNPLDIICLCDSRIFINGLQGCFYEDAERRSVIVRIFYETLCYNPHEFYECDSL
ncbi:uncharacterized protein T551_02732 [Pneumocystis jirovecii RU7]|uniref:CFEM domain-containing protein n=1 Tax=Pneumocystis jirovecii (strain RU7) TaxID=1408657 RepID=A0A0W4ZIW5_PNEJ7|nr:uncharacterized protein T551_02732 [Pneumocystis jirovecii RU7]KTW28313.1 hypothetical protein T551_02732 [Pneumocystis jirovecii RU7]